MIKLRLFGLSDGTNGKGFDGAKGWAKKPSRMMKAPIWAMLTSGLKYAPNIPITSKALIEAKVAFALTSCDELPWGALSAVMPASRMTKIRTKRNISWDFSQTINRETRYRCKAIKVVSPR